jgi:N-dimethylarginine dimethylaminohydrolase
MSAFAPHLKAELEQRGLRVITPVVQELGKGGGYIRCTTLTLDNI